MMVWEAKATIWSSSHRGLPLKRFACNSAHIGHPTKRCFILAWCMWQRNVLCVLGWKRCSSHLEGTPDGLSVKGVQLQGTGTAHQDGVPLLRRSVGLATSRVLRARMVAKAQRGQREPALKDTQGSWTRCCDMGCSTGGGTCVAVCAIGPSPCSNAQQGPSSMPFIPGRGQRMQGIS